MSSAVASHCRVLETTASECPYEIPLQNIPFCQLLSHQWLCGHGPVEVPISSGLHQSAGNEDCLNFLDMFWQLLDIVSKCRRTQF
eukprot:8512797-Ditylum_brightwellii.AAC.1